jgi:hypothetical protein
MRCVLCDVRPKFYTDIIKPELYRLSIHVGSLIVYTVAAEYPAHARVGIAV